MPHLPKPEELREFQRLFTPLVSDVMDRLGIAGQVLNREIQSIPFDPSVKVAGLAFPCAIEPTSEYVEIDTLLEMVDNIPANSIVMVSSPRDIDASLWGGLMSTRAQKKGAVGSVV